MQIAPVVGCQRGGDKMGLKSRRTML